MSRGRFKQSEGSTRAGKAMTLRPMQGSEPGYRMYPACHACYRWVDAQMSYCESCRASGAAGRHLVMRQRMGV
jgi:hypothetical protein